MDVDEYPALMIDAGSGMLKAGFCGDDGPRVVCPNVLGTPRDQLREGDFPDLLHQYTGDAAMERRGVLSLDRPVTHGSVRDWDAMETVLQAAFSEMHVDPRKHPVLMGEPPLNPLANRELMTQLMFEKFDVPGFYMMTQGVLSLFASGRHMGVMVDSGEGVTHVMPIEGLVVRPHAIHRVNCAGGDVTEYLQRLMTETGFNNMEDPSGLETVREVKEELCYVAKDFDAELERAESSSALERTFQLPDGREITLGNQRFRAPEALFQPIMIGKDQDGLHRMVYKSIMQCDIDVRALFYNNVILCGGNTMFEGLGERLRKEVKKLAPPSIHVSVVQSPERKYSGWIGGSILGSLSMFQSMWITRQDYDEEGPSLVHKKCS